MAETDDVPEQSPEADYLAPFESFQAFGLRGGAIFRGRVREEFARDRAVLEEALGSAPGSYRVEELDGRVYATIRTYRGRRAPRRLWLHAVLLALTVVTTVAAGANLAGGVWSSSGTFWPFDFVVRLVSGWIAGNLGEVVRVQWPYFVEQVRSGIPYAAALLFVLLAHEMGHYTVARWYGVDATLPFVLPAPFFFGTFGAIIRMRSPIIHRRALFDIGAAGPIAGLAAGVIMTVVGLGMSRFVPRPPTSMATVQLGDCLLMKLLTRAVMGPTPPMHEVFLHPVGVAGWFGLFVTFLNLMPLGQLDGGHVWYALVGRYQRYVGTGAFGLLVAMGVLFPGWLFFALLVLVVLRIQHPPVMDESVRLGRGRKVVGVILILVFFLLFIPEPVSLAEFGG